MRSDVDRDAAACDDVPRERRAAVVCPCEDSTDAQCGPAVPRDAALAAGAEARARGLIDVKLGSHAQHQQLYNGSVQVRQGAG